MLIRKALQGELSAVMEIYDSARAYMRENGNPEQWAGGYPARELIESDIENGFCHVCVEGEEILGVFYYAEGNDPTYEVIEDGAWLDDAPYGVIHRIAVAARGRGVAAACFDFALARCGNVKIDTHACNLPMQHTLAKNGFSRCGTIYVEDGSPRIAYQKRAQAKKY